MADLPISGLPAAVALTGTELVPVVQSGVTVQTTVDDVAALASGGGTSSRLGFSTSTNTVALGSAAIYACTDSTVTRTLTISTATIALGSTSDVLTITIKDESGTLVSNGTIITIATEGAQTIDGDASLNIIADYGVAKLYSDGSNLYSL